MKNRHEFAKYQYSIRPRPLDWTRHKIWFFRSFFFSFILLYILDTCVKNSRTKSIVQVAFRWRVIVSMHDANELFVSRSLDIVGNDFYTPTAVCVSHVVRIGVLPCEYHDRPDESVVELIIEDFWRKTTQIYFFFSPEFGWISFNELKRKQVPWKTSLMVRDLFKQRNEVRILFISSFRCR